MSSNPIFLLMRRFIVTNLSLEEAMLTTTAILRTREVKVFQRGRVLSLLRGNRNFFVHGNHQRNVQERLPWLTATVIIHIDNLTTIVKVSNQQVGSHTQSF